MEWHELEIIWDVRYHCRAAEFSIALLKEHFPNVPKTYSFWIFSFPVYYLHQLRKIATGNFCFVYYSFKTFVNVFETRSMLPHFIFRNIILFFFFLYLWSKKTRLAALNVLCIRSNFQQIAFCLKPQVSLLWCSLLNATQSAVYSIRVSLKYDIALWSWIVEFFNFICGIHTMVPI